MDSPLKGACFTGRTLPPAPLPREWWLAECARALSSAIDARLQEGSPEGMADGTVIAWISELQGVLMEIASMIPSKHALMQGRR